MRYLCAELIIDGNLRKGVVVDVSESGEVQVVGELKDLPCETENTTYIAQLKIENGKLKVKN